MVMSLLMFSHCAGRFLRASHSAQASATSFTFSLIITQSHGILFLFLLFVVGKYFPISS
jgi:hypothetical protein